MKVDYHPHISLAETNGIILAVKKLFSYDLSVFSPANLQLLISSYIEAKGIQLPDILISRMNDYPDVFEDLLCWLDVTDTEMFRNPDVWISLNRKIIPDLLREGCSPKVWFPSCSTGEELYSFAILAHEYAYREKIELSASSISRLRLKEAERGLFMGNTLDISRENYYRSEGKIEIEHYIEKIDKYIVRKKQIRHKIDFSLQDPIPQKREQPVDLIIFKNRLIYYTPAAGIRVVNNLLDSLSGGGYLVLGYKEKISDKKLLSRLRQVSDEEKIYQLS